MENLRRKIDASFSRITATFCVSHGDEIKELPVSLGLLIGDLNDKWKEYAFQKTFREMNRVLQEEVKRNFQPNEFSTPHLVTHPDDRP